MAWFSPLRLDSSQPAARNQIINWWETRRLRFNLWVGVAGVITLLLIYFAGHAAVGLGVDFHAPRYIFCAILFGLAANFFYTFGWMIDLLFYRGQPRTFLYKAGFIFSCILTLFPGFWAIGLWIYTSLTGRTMP